MRRTPPKINNTSHFANATVREVVRFVAKMLDLPGGVEIDVEPLRTRRSAWRGRAYGTRYCFVKVSPTAEMKWLVKGIAHELRHLDQTANRYRVWVKTDLTARRRSEADCRSFEDRVWKAWLARG